MTSFKLTEAAVFCLTTYIKFFPLHIVMQYRLVVTDVSGQPIGPIVLDCLTLEDVPKCW